MCPISRSPLLAKKKPTNFPRTLPIASPNHAQQAHPYLVGIVEAVASSWEAVSGQMFYGLKGTEENARDREDIGKTIQGVIQAERNAQADVIAMF